MNGDSNAIRKRAAEWLALREARGFTAVEHANFADWCAAEPRHAQVFAEVESAWRTFDRLAAYPHSIDEAADPDLLAKPTRPVRWVVWGGLAAAACVALVAWMAWSPPVLERRDVVPESMAQIGPRTMRLSDGSDVEVNIGSEVREEFTPGERRVRLIRGEAHFTVTKDPARPFIVDAGKVAVRAVGTAFNVRREAARVEVLVTEGRVRVDSAVGADTQAPAATEAASAPELTAGQRIILPDAPSPAVTSVVETLSAPAIDRALAWQSRRLTFDATALGDVVARLNQLNAGRPGHLRLTVTDPQLAALRITGRIRPDDVESFVEALEANFGVAADRRTDGEIVLRRR